MHLARIVLTSTHFDDDLIVGSETFSSTSGATIYGNYQFNDNVFPMLAAGAESDEKNGFEITSSVSYFGGGFALPVGNQTDIVMRLALVSVEEEVCYYFNTWSACKTVDDDGYDLGIGVRYMANQNIEVNADYIQVNLDEFEDSDSLSIGGAIWFANHHSIRLSFGDTDDAKTSALGYRYTF